MKRNHAFTLAETLITLAVIGVVAAMTIPNLVQNYEKKTVATKVKKTYAELSQVIKLSETDNGPMNSWMIGDTEAATKSNIREYIAPYINLTECPSSSFDYCGGMRVGSQAVNYILKNGVGLSFQSANSIDTGILLLINVKTGKKNKDYLQGKDSFYFIIKDGRILPIRWYNGITREEILGKGYLGDTFNGTNNYYRCGHLTDVTENLQGEKTYNRHGCTALFYIDGFEFKDDYPW